MTSSPATALYVHVPFCLRKCRYCDFYSVERRPDLISPWLAALATELHNRSAALDLRTLYIGGGTPTSLSLDQLDSLLSIFRDELDLSRLLEFTVEANPGTLSPEKLYLMRSQGVNRLSLGVQSFDNRILGRLGRIHSAFQALHSLSQARQAGFDNLSLDLIFAVPGQTLAGLRSDLARALSTNVGHISAYGLTYEEGTPLHADLLAGRIHPHDEAAELAMYRAVRDTLTHAGFEHYEVSNYARPGMRSLHNQTYWRNEAYVGIGPAAVTYLDGVRSTNVRDVERYLQLMKGQGDATIESESLDPRRRAGETAMLGLRMTQGLDEKEFASRTGFTLSELAGPAFDRLIDMGLLGRHLGRVFLTDRGMELADSILSEFI